METQKKQHPPELHLAALALGKLKADVASKIQSHLSDCEECSRYVSETPRDDLAEVIRQAKGKRAADQNTQATGLSGTIAGLQTSPLGPSPPDSGPATPPGSPPSSTSNAAQHTVSENEIPRDLYAQSKYRIICVLGRGGMGTVYEAEHVRMKRPVAIKVINPELVNHPQALLRFEEEIKAVASLDHANIARAFDAENIGSLQVFVMEFVRGQTLYDFLKSRGRLSVVDACRCVRQALIGLQHAHQQGLVHRDLKPQNLMLTRDTGQIKILDFGLAKAVSENRQSRRLTGSQATMGTYAYMAPEQALDAANADIRADIYSLGCTLYYLIGGVLPFDYETDAKLLLAHQNEMPCLLHEFRTDVPEALSNLVAKMLAKNPAERPQTPREAADALLPFARGDANLSPAMFADPLARPATKRRGMDRWKWGGIAAAVLLAFGFGGWAAGLFSVRTPYGTIVVENAPADADVSIDGNSVTFTRNGDSLVIEAVERGEHHLKLSQSGREILSNDVKIEMAGQLVTVKFKPIERPAAPSTPKPPPASEQPPTAKSTPPAPKAPATDKPDSLAAKPSAPTGNEANPAPPLKTADGFVQLFNGRDLDGWKCLPGSWTVENGALKPVLATTTQLYSERDDYKNVHVRVKYHFTKAGHFGVYVRGGYGPKDRSSYPDGLEVLCKGEGVQDAGNAGVLWLGKERKQEFGNGPLPINDQIQVDFIIQSDRASISINGQPIPPYVDSKHELAPRGHIILQSKLGEAAIESVEIKELAESGSTEQIGPVNQPAGGRKATENATLFPLNSRWTGMRRRGDNETPVTATVVEAHGNVVVLNYLGRQLRCAVNGSHVKVLADDPRHTDTTGSNFSTSNVEVSGKIVDRELSLDGTEDQWLRGKRQIQGNPVKFVLRREDGPLTGDKNSDAISALVREGAYRQTTQLFWHAEPDVFGNLVASAIADANKLMPTPQDARVLGELCLVGGDAVAAERPLRAAIDTAGRPDRPALSDYKNLTWCLVAQGKNDEARQLFEKALKDRSGPDDMYADADRATAAYISGVISEQQYTEQLAAHKDLPACFPWFYVGQRQEIDDKGEAAVTAYRRCIELVDAAKPHYVAAFARWRLAALDEERAVSEEDANSAADHVAPPVPAGSSSTIAANEDSDFVPLFNGKDLTGWNTDTKSQSIWKVKNGILTGKGATPHILISDRADFENVTVRVKARINDGGNSGIFIRVNPGQAPSYEAQINSTAPDPNPTGSIIRDGRVVLYKPSVPPPPPGDWFVEETILDGDRVTILVNGKQVAKFDDPNHVPRGRIGLQMHDDRTVVEFASVEVRELPGSTRPTVSTPQANSPSQRTAPRTPPKKPKKQPRKK